MKRGQIWWAYYYLDGVRHQQSTGTSNRRQAEAVLQKLKIEANARRFGRVDADPEITVGALAARFIANASPSAYQIGRLSFLLPFFSELRVLRLTREMTREYRRLRKLEKPVGDATVNRDLSVLRRLLYWAVEERVNAANPLAKLGLERERHKKRPVVSMAEEEQFLAWAPVHLRKMVITALDTGMRRGEVLGQCWEDVDLSRRILSVTKSKTPEGEAREIPLTRRLVDLLSAAPKPSGPIFLYKEDPIASMKTAWRLTLKRAQLRHFRFHDLRHTFNTRLMEAGVLQEVRMALMGHSSGQKVHSIYTHIELPVKREAIRRLEQWVQQQNEANDKGGLDAHQTS